MKNLRKTISVLMLVVMVFLAVGCSNASKNTPSASASPSPSASTSVEPSKEPEKIDYPTKEILAVVPFNAGGGTDIAARIFFKYLNKYLPKQVVATNVTGAAGTVGAKEVLASAADGYKLLVSYGGYPVSHVTGAADFTYKDFTPVAKFSDIDNAIVVNAESNYKTMADLIDAAKANPGKIKVGAGYGTLAHFGVIAIEKATGVDFNIVDIGGTVPKAPELLANRVDAYFDPMGSVAQYLKSGQFRCIATYGAERNPLTPDYPTLKEQGIDVVLAQQYGIFAPKDLPEEINNILNEAIKKACEDPELAKEFENSYILPDYLNNAEYTEYLANEFNVLTTLGEGLK